MSQHAIVLAAGKGTRMKSDLAKVLHEAAGRTLLDWSLSALGNIDLESIAVVVGHQAAAVTASIADHELAPLVATALQAEQLGTGHAAAIGLGALQVDPADTVMVIPGDMPLLRPETLQALLAEHQTTGAVAMVATARMDDPFGYGRIQRDGARVVAIVEQADASPEIAAIDEVNTSVYTFRAGPLRDLVGRLDTANAQGEQYLTDVVAMLTAAGEQVGGFLIDVEEAFGVNSVEQLHAAADILRSRTA
jgi:bifunctional UDP-N-acetylglucosamine pyrophosphorylase/glucosamine-1-phosphate N-acetyltransferase